MKTVQITKQSRAVNALLDKARQEDVLVQAADGSQFLLAVVDDYEEEIARTRKNKEFMAFLDQRAKEPATLTLDQVKKRLGLDTKNKRIPHKRQGTRDRA